MLDGMSESAADATVDAEVVDLCRELIRMDTSNYGDDSGPGERKAAEYVATLLDEVGIESRLYESDARPDLARGALGRRPRATPLLLHGHLDVVPAAAEDWQVDPFAGEIQDGYLWGRGAVDMKDFDAMLLSVVRHRQRTGRVPDRPIVLCFTADEEAGGHSGAQVLVEQHRDELEGCTEAVGEVGGFSTTVRGRRLYLIEAAEKGMAWLKLTARGTAGHGSMVNPDNAVARLTAAVARIGAYEWPVRLTPTMEVLLATVGDLAGTEVTPENGAGPGPGVRRRRPDARRGHQQHRSSRRCCRPATRSTWSRPRRPRTSTAASCPATRTSSGPRSRSWSARGSPSTRSSWQQPWETPYDGALVASMERSILAEDPDGIVAPYLMSGGTDAKHFRALGLRSYGFAPLRLPADLDFTALFHGVDERVPIDALEFGARVLDRFLDEV